MRGSLTVIVFLLNMSPALAAGEGSSWYIGAGGGESASRDVCSYAESMSYLGTCDDEAVAWKVFAGHQMSKYLGFELSYTDPGETEIVGSTSSPGTLGIHPHLVSFSGKLDIPFGEHLSIFGKVGLTYFKVDYNRTGSFLALNTGDDGLEPSVGAGAEVKISRHFGVRAEWEHFNDAVGGLGQGNIDLVTASVLYRF